MPWPDDQATFFEQVVGEMRGLLSIGWRAADDLFCNMLRSGNEMEQRHVEGVVYGPSNSVLMQLSELTLGRNKPPVMYDRGFTNWLKDDRLMDFIGRLN